MRLITVIMLLCASAALCWADVAGLQQPDGQVTDISARAAGPGEVVLCEMPAGMGPFNLCPGGTCMDGKCRPGGPYHAIPHAEILAARETERRIERAIQAELRALAIERLKAATDARLAELGVARAEVEVAK